MFCAAQRQFSDFSLAVDTAAMERRLPYMGCLELTYRCNQSCRHCYCNLAAGDLRKSEELSTARIRGLLDEAADAGCFWLLLTGGEVLLREDFGEVYLHAVRCGMLVEVFTNATLIDERHAARFGEFPPLGVDISIYGSVPRLHDAITGVKGSFARTMEGIRLLRSHGVRFSLKTILMTLNFADLAGMRALADDLGVKFRYDTLICPRTDGGMSPVSLRLSSQQMARQDLDDDYEACQRIFAGFWDKKPAEALTCGAGVFAFNINPYGVMSPCTMFRSFQYPLEGMPFTDAWKKMVSERDARKEACVSAECRSCSMLLICSNCPAWSEIEAGALDAKVPYICDYAKLLEKEFLEKQSLEKTKRRGYEEKAVSETGA